MTTLLRDKRTLERKVGPVEFRRGWLRDSEESAVEVHLATPMSWDDDDRTHESTWLGHGETHLDAIADCYETLRVRSRADTRVCAGDYQREQWRGR